MISLSTILSHSTTWYLLLLVSFLGGLIASVSPCSLAMLPLIIGYVGGFSEETPLKTFIQLCSFIFGTALIFTSIGIICALTGSVFSSVFGVYFTLIIASLLMILGLKLLGVLNIEAPIFIKSIPSNNSNSIFLYPVLIGAIFALAGTPCSTPILVGIMAFAAMGKSLILAISMLFLFSIGQGLIIIIAGVFTSSIKRMKSFARYSDILLKFSGMLLILVSLYLYLKIFLPLI